MSFSKGLSLIEILFSIMIIAILSLASIPIMIRSTARFQLKSAVNQTASLLRIAKQKAVNTRLDCVVEIDPIQDQISLKQNGHLVHEIWSAPQGVDLADVSGNNSLTQITFKPTGTATNRSIHFITHGTQINGTKYNPSSSYTSGPANSPKERTKCFTITTDNVTGRVRILRYGLNQPWGTSVLS